MAEITEADTKGTEVAIYKISKDGNAGAETVARAIVGKGYQEQPIGQGIRLNLEEPRLFLKEHKTEAKPSLMLKQFGVSKDEHKLAHSVVLLCQIEETVFAITTGVGYAAVRPYCDTHFSQKLAARLLHKSGPKSFKVKMLVGNTRRGSKSVRKSEPTDPFAMAIYTNFDNRLRKDSSIRHIQCLRKAGITAEFGLGAVKFGVPIKANEYFPILQHLRDIDNGLRTYQFDTHKNALHEPHDFTLLLLYYNYFKEEDSEAYKQYILAVPGEMNEELNNELLKLCFEAKRNNSKISNFDISWKEDGYKEFFNSTSIMLKDSSRILHKYAETPTIKDIIERVEMNTETTVEDFRKYKLAFHPRAESNYLSRESVFNVIEGDLHHAGQVYWRVMAQWCAVSSDLLLETQKKFVEILRDHLLVPSNPLSLRKVWDMNSKVDEDVYNMSYDGEPGYIVGDNTVPDSIEVFDIAFMAGDTTCIYHVKSHFGQTTRDVCSQLINSVEIISESFRRTSKEPGTLQKLYGRLTSHVENLVRPKDKKTKTKTKTEEEKRKEWEQMLKANERKKRTKDIYPEWDTFHKIFENPTFVLALAPNRNLSQDMQMAKIDRIWFKNLRDRKARRSLFLESQLLTTLDAETIQRYCIDIRPGEVAEQNSFCSKLLRSIMKTEAEIPVTSTIRGVLSAKVLALLQSNEYVTENSNEVTAKLMYANQGDFKLEGISNPTAQTIYGLLSPFMSFFASLGAKLSVVRLHKSLEEKGMLKQFKICEISTKKPPKEDKNCSPQPPTETDSSLECSQMEVDESSSGN